MPEDEPADEPDYRDLQDCVCGAGYDLQSIYDDLVDTDEIARRLGVGIHRVRRWIERREKTGSPHWVLRRRTGPLYSMAHWRSWYALWRVTRGSETWSTRRTEPRNEDR